MKRVLCYIDQVVGAAASQRQLLLRKTTSVATIIVAVLLAALGVAKANSPYATELVDQNGAYGPNSLYNDPNAVLGEPTRIAVNGDPFLGTGSFHVKIVEPAINRDVAGNNVITTLSRKSDGAGGFTYGSITVKFDHPIVDDPTNPYGIDLNVFGNAFYQGNGLGDDTSDMRTTLVGNIFAEPVVISVSPDNVNWFTYSGGPFGDTAFPTQGYAWSAAQHDATGNGWTTTATDFTKPVNPALNSVLGVTGQSLSAADAMATYVGSGGGTGIDLAASGFSSIQYVRVQSTAQLREGEIDAIADVRPAHLGEALSITPANVAAGASLYFQNATNETQTAVVTKFTSIDGLAKLATSPVTNSSALAALPSGNLLAGYQLDVLSLIGAGEVDFAADYQLSPGQGYVGNGSDLTLLDWNGSAWQAMEFTFDALTRRIVIYNWTQSTATFAITQPMSAADHGDFNGDRHVDAADYAVWRKGLGSAYMADQFNVWRINFGNSFPPGGGGSLASDPSTVPEPNVVTLLVVFALTRGLPRRCR